MFTRLLPPFEEPAVSLAETTRAEGWLTCSGVLQLQELGPRVSSPAESLARMGILQCWELMFLSRYYIPGVVDQQLVE